jgi:hypothetical protein
VAVEADGDILVADSGGGLSLQNGGVFRVDPASGARTAVSANGAPAGGPAFGYPSGVAIEADGHILVADSDAFGGTGGVIRVDPASGARTAVSANSGPCTFNCGLDFVRPDGLAVVPPSLGAPPPVTIGDVIASVQALDLPAGIEHALVAKLTGAQRDQAANNHGGACGKLGAFINQVKAQDAKKILPDAQALTDQATAASQSLGCAG